MTYIPILSVVKAAGREVVNSPALLAPLERKTAGKDMQWWMLKV